MLREECNEDRTLRARRFGRKYLITLRASEWRRTFQKILSCGDVRKAEEAGSARSMDAAYDIISFGKIDEVLRSALAGVPRLATVIAYMPPQDRERAFTAAKQSYERTAQKLGYTRAAARQWASAVLRRLKEEVAELQGAGRMEVGNEPSFPKIDIRT